MRRTSYPKSGTRTAHSVCSVQCSGQPAASAIFYSPMIMKRIKYYVHKMFSIMLLTPELAQTLAISRPRAWSSAPSYFVHTLPCLSSYYQEFQGYTMEMLAACPASKGRLEPRRWIRWQHQSCASICINVRQFSLRVLCRNTSIDIWSGLMLLS